MTEAVDGPDIGAELDAMKTVGEALGKLDPDGRKRVLGWASDRFGFVPAGGARGAHNPSNGNSIKEPGADADKNDLSGFDSFAEFHAQLDLPTDADRALAAAYWFKRREGRSEFSGFDVNTELTQLGHKVSNITKALSTLSGRKPQLILQKGKAGKSKQARKTYAISQAGEKEIENRLRGEA